MRSRSCYPGHAYIYTFTRSPSLFPSFPPRRRASIANTRPDGPRARDKPEPRECGRVCVRAMGVVCVDYGGWTRVANAGAATHRRRRRRRSIASLIDALALTRQHVIASFDPLYIMCTLFRGCGGCLVAPEWQT